MLAEFYKELHRHASAQAKLEIVTIPGDPRRVYVTQNGQKEVRELPPPIVEDTIHSFVDFIDEVNRCADAASGSPPAVYHDDKRLVVLRDSTDRRDGSTLPLQTSERWAAVLDLAKGFSGTQKEAIHFLRFGLGLERTDPTLVGIRKLDFVRNSTGKNVAEHGRESLGRSVEMSVQQADQIPDQFDVSVTPVTNRGLESLQVVVRVGVVLDLEGQRVIFRALPDEIPRARNAWVNGIGSLLKEELSGSSAFVIHGSP